MTALKTQLQHGKERTHHARRAAVTLCALAALCAPAAHAQWVKINEQFGGIFYANNDTLILGTKGGWAISRDGGNTWVQKLIFETDSLRIYASAVDPCNSAIWYASVDNATNVDLHKSGFYKTTNAGETWAKQNDTVFGGGELIVSWSNPDVIYYVDGVNGNNQTAGFRRSDDGGKTWNLIYGITEPPHSGGNASISFVQDQVDSNTIYWYATYYDDQLETFLSQFDVSTNKGNTFVEIFPPPIGPFASLYASPTAAGDIYFEAANEPTDSALWHSGNFGNTWDNNTSIAIAKVTNSSGFGIIISRKNPDLQFAALDTGVIIKYPGTTNWQYLPGEDTLTNVQILMFDDVTNTLYANNQFVGEGWKLWKWQMTSAVREKTNTINDNCTLGQVYPNPVENIGIIPFHLYEGANIQMIIINALGKEVKTTSTMNLSAGDYAIPIDLSNFPPGAYFYTLKTKFQQFTKELTIVR